MLFQMIIKIQVKDQIIAALTAGPWPKSLQPVSSTHLQSMEINWYRHL